MTKEEFNKIIDRAIELIRWKTYSCSALSVASSEFTNAYYRNSDIREFYVHMFRVTYYNNKGTRGVAPVEAILLTLSDEEFLQERTALLEEFREVMIETGMFKHLTGLPYRKIIEQERKALRSYLSHAERMASIYKKDSSDYKACLYSFNYYSERDRLNSITNGVKL